jgi:Na+:H+ antiporter, NhaA family
MGRSSRGLNIGQVLLPFQEFFRQQASGGIVLMVCTVAALVWANSPWAACWSRLRSTLH